MSSGSTSKRVPRPSQVRAGAVGRVEREVPGGQLLEGAVPVRAGQVLGEGEGVVGLAVLGLADRLAVAAHDLDLGHAVGQPQGRLQRVGEAALDALPHHEAVDDDLDGVLLVAGQVDLVGELVDLAVDAGPGEALGGQVGEERLVGALAAADDRGQHLEAGALGQLEDAVDDLLRGLAGDRRAALGAVGHADAGVEQPQVVVDLGDRADRGAGVAGGRLLVDRDGRRQALDEVDVGLVHLAEELAGVGRQRLDVAALALGVDRVEGQRRLARARQAGEDDELVARQLDGDVLQVVLAGTPDDERIRHREQATGRDNLTNCMFDRRSGELAGDQADGTSRPSVERRPVRLTERRRAPRRRRSSAARRPATRTIARRRRTATSTAAEQRSSSSATLSQRRPAETRAALPEERTPLRAIEHVGSGRRARLVEARRSTRVRPIAEPGTPMRGDHRRRRPAPARSVASVPLSADDADDAEQDGRGERVAAAPLRAARRRRTGRRHRRAGSARATARPATGGTPAAGRLAEPATASGTASEQAGDEAEAEPSAPTAGAPASRPARGDRATGGRRGARPRRRPGPRRPTAHAEQPRDAAELAGRTARSVEPPRATRSPRSRSPTRLAGRAARCAVPVAPDRRARAPR